MKILVLKRDKIGDMLLTTPMLKHLRASLPHAEIHLLANDYNAWVVEGNPDIDRLWVYRRVKHAGRIHIGAAFGQLLQFVQLRRQRYDMAIAAGGVVSARAIRRLIATGAKRSIAYIDKDSANAGLTDPMPLPTGVHEVDLNLRLLSPLGIGLPDQPGYPNYQPLRQSQNFAGDWLRSRNIRPNGFVVLGLGARRAKKQPTTRQILSWSQHLKETHGLDTVFIWTPGKSDNPLYPGDDEVAQLVLDAGAPHIHPFRGPLQPALGLIWQARTSIFPDSGLMHFAAASPGGVLGLFAETDVSPHPSQWGPRGAKADYLEAAKSVAELSDDVVYAKLQRLLDAEKTIDRITDQAFFP